MNALTNRRPFRRPTVWVRRAGRENALYDSHTGVVHLLNDTARAIWDLCDGDTDPEEMVAAICELSHTPRDVVNEDVDRILAEFDLANLILWKEE